jgi:superfamily II DNA/RNA helicase
MFNPIKASSNIKRSFIDYISTSFSFADPHFARLFRGALMEDGMLSKGPYLDIGGSYTTGKSLKELAEINQASRLFATLEKLPEKDKELKYERPLYSHQEEALRYARNGGNLVVTTGTGSGKTECFLLPILQSLLEEIEVETLTRAVRAIVIYPMNALANDQMKRLRKILATCPEITFGLYNGNTRHRQTQAEADYRSLHDSAPLPNEMISREAMQNEPPHILITNYSMLEYMMLRPKDDAVFSGEKLRYIVLDEAHIYRGATGIETALLMRRLRARISKPNSVQYILTSATLGGKDADAEIVEFAENLCSTMFKPENIIRSIEIRQPMIEHRNFPPKLFAELNAPVRPVGEILEEYDADFAPNCDESEKLFELMLRCSLFSKLRETASVAKTVSNIASEMGISQEELVNLIAVSSKADKNGTSLIKARYHFFLRALEGVYITLAGERNLYLTRKEYDEKRNPVFECAICDGCGRVALAGKIDNGRLYHPKQGFDDSADFFLIKQDSEMVFFSAEDEDEEQPDGAEPEESSDENDYVLCPTCGAIEMESAARHTTICEHTNHSYIKLRKARTRDSGFAACPACEFGSFRKFYLGYEAATAVLGTALFEQLPEYESIPVPTSIETKDAGFFGIVKEKKPTQTIRARQYLTFSDSRADAAFFASYMEKSYREFLRRRGLWQVCEKMLDQGRSVLTVRDVVSALARLFENNGSFVEIGKERESQTDICHNQAYIAVTNELISSRRASGLVQLGKLAYLYAPKTDHKRDNWNKAIKTIANKMPFSENAERDAKALLNLLMIDTVYGGALDAGDELAFNADEREYLFYTSIAKKIVKMKMRGDRNYRTGWIPRRRTGKTENFYPSTRMTRVMRAMGWDAEYTWGVLGEIWLKILGFEEDTEYALPVQDFDIALYDSEKQSGGLRLYRCEICGRVTAHNCQCRCVNVKCKGTLKDFDPISANAFNHYISLYNAPNLKPFYIKEHTAQLSRERGAEYQKLFIEKKINALSSSTTFEMGVDVGSLETVFLRDVPPTPANYIQRAGRAGRSLQFAAYALTYAKLSSHDFSYFAHPENMISGRIKAPMFRLENEKIIRRHINAVALSAFLKEHDEVYDGDNQSELLNGGGYEKLKDFLAARPIYLKNLLMNSIPSGNYGIEDWSWTEHLVGEYGILEMLVKDFRDTVAFLEAERERCRKEGNDFAAATVFSKLRNFRADKELDKRDGFAPRKSLINFLVRNNVLPKYGFPVDTVELLPNPVSAKDANRPQMQRDLQLAVAEYAPGSEIVADGMLYTSRYIHKSPSKSAYNWEYGWYAKCPNRNCQADNFYNDNTLGEDLTCRSCGHIIKKIFWHKTLEPRRGFIAGNSDSDKPKPVKMRKPEKNYKTDDVYIGDPSRRIIDKRIFSVNGNILEIESTANDSLVVRTQTKFKVCTSCGYATGEGETYNPKHQNAYGSKCSNEGAGREFYLTHEFKTDVARITFKNQSAADYNCMISVLFALLEAMSKELDIERNDIKGCLFRKKLDNGMIVYNLIIYDAVAGGAGHSRRIVTPDGKVLSKVIQRAIKMMDDCDCEPSCYKCLRSYYNQKLHDNLDRKSAANFLRNFAGLIEVVD